MKQTAYLLTSLFVAALAHAAGINVALNQPVTLNGSFPTYTYPGALCGTNPPQPAASTVDDGIFLPAQTCFQSGAYWSSQNPSDSIDISFGGTFLVSSAIVQADDNDTYILQYRDPGGVYHDWWTIAPPGGFGLTTSQDSALPAVMATGVRFLAPAGSGDGFFAVSEIQVFTATPEPASLLFIGLTLVGGSILIRRRQKV